jgi:peptidoglycan/LPS O-acetylase OafA/YrhL
LDATVYGVLLAFMNVYYQKVLQLYKRRLTAIGTLLFLTGCGLFVVYAESDILNLGSAVLLFPMVNLGFSMILINFFYIQKSDRYRGLSNLVERISLISYSVYLLHFTIWGIMYHFFSPSMHPALKVSIFAAFWILTYFVSLLSYTYIEKAFLRMRDRLTA